MNKTNYALMLPVEIFWEKEGYGIRSSPVGNCGIYYDGSSHYLVVYAGHGQTAKTMVPISEQDYDRLNRALNRYNSYLTYPGKTALNLRALQQEVSRLTRKFSASQNEDIWVLLDLKRNEMPITLVYDERKNRIRPTVAIPQLTGADSNPMCSVYYRSGQAYFVVKHGERKTVVPINRQDYTDIIALLDRFRSYGYDFGKILQNYQALGTLVDNLLKRFRKEELENIYQVIDTRSGINIPAGRRQAVP